MASRPKHPVSAVEWVPAVSLTPNDYNPNIQPPPEHRLLKISILEDGWTQPVVIHDDGSGATPAIIDGEHRWRLVMHDAEVAALTDGQVPIVRLRGSRAHRMMSTIRHNRARGEHAVKGMADIVRELLAAGETADDICFLLQMEPEEVTRLADRAGMPERVSRDGAEFSKGWIPG